MLFHAFSDPFPTSIPLFSLRFAPRHKFSRIKAASPRGIVACGRASCVWLKSKVSREDSRP